VRESKARARDTNPSVFCAEKIIDLVDNPVNVERQLGAAGTDCRVVFKHFPVIAFNHFSLAGNGKSNSDT